MNSKFDGYTFITKKGEGLYTNRIGFVLLLSSRQYALLLK